MINTTKLLAILGCAIFIIYFCGCSKTEKGELVGESVSISLDEAINADIKNMYYQGTVIIKLDDGSEVKALCKKEMVDNLRGGQILEIKYDNTLKNWVVKKILK